MNSASIQRENKKNGLIDYSLVFHLILWEMHGHTLSLILKTDLSCIDSFL